LRSGGAPARRRRPGGRRPAGYGEDLAHVHDAGFSDFAERAAPFLLAQLRPLVPEGGRVVDLGCGSGRLAFHLARAGYAVLGVDRSAALLALARRRAPGATFRRASFLDLELPPCHAVVALGEVFNYRFDPRVDAAALRRLFRRVYRALSPGGLFAFDVAGPARAPRSGFAAGWKMGDGWAVLFEKEARRSGRTLARRVVTFRRVGRSYRRSEELHLLRLYPEAEVRAALERAGFEVRMRRGYGALRLGRGLAAFLARKPLRPAPLRPGGA